ncbi:MAG TPA: hypothetical protein VF271_04325 [Rhodanobacteraceae bacterium]
MPESPSTSHVAGQLLKLLVALALVAYPAGIYWAQRYVSPTQLLAGLLALLGVRALLATWLLPRHARRQLALGVACLIAGALVWWLVPNVRMDWLRWYPALLDAGVAALFLGSLMSGKPLVERIARAMEPHLPPAGVVYTRRVTWAWGVLMLLITLVAAVTAVAGSLRAWSVFNGGIVYAVMIAAFAIEYAVRRRVRRRWSEHALSA